MTTKGGTPWVQFAGDRRYRLIHIELPLPNLPQGLDGFRFLHLSDVHLRPEWPAVLDEAIPELMSCQPRLVLFTGDVVEDRFNQRPSLPNAHRFFGAVRTELGTYGVLGNHDGRALVGNMVSAWGGELPVRFLLNSRVVLSVEGAELELIGLAGWNARQTNRGVLEGFPPRSAGAVRVVMCHYPDVIKRAGPILRPDLYLAGHTHGGQVCLPGLPAVMSHDSLPKRYVGGFHRYGGEWGGTWLNVSRGLGFSHWQIRTFCPPEAHVFTLVRG